MTHTYSIHFFFFFNDTATTEIYTLSLHDALPISPTAATCVNTRDFDRPPRILPPRDVPAKAGFRRRGVRSLRTWLDRKSTRLNSSHQIISYAVFCLKKKKQRETERIPQRDADDKT